MDDFIPVKSEKVGKIEEFIKSLGVEELHYINRLIIERLKLEEHRSDAALQYRRKGTLYRPIRQR